MRVDVDVKDFPGGRRRAGYIDDKTERILEVRMPSGRIHKAQGTIKIPEGASLAANHGFDIVGCPIIDDEITGWQCWLIMDAVPLDSRGLPVTIDALNGCEDVGIDAVMPSDDLVTIVDFTHIRVGTGHDSAGVNKSISWDYQLRGNYPGLYEAMRGLLLAIRTERDRRVGLGRGIKRFESYAHSLGYQAFNDVDIRDTILSDGWSRILSEL